MNVGYYHNCTFFALLRTTNGGEPYTHTILHFMGEPADSPRVFFDWVKDQRKIVSKDADPGTAVLILDCKVIEPVTDYFYEFSKQ